MIVIYIIILIVIIIFFEIFNNIDNINYIFIPKKKEKESFTLINLEEENIYDKYDKTEIQINNNDRRIIKFNNEIKYSPIENLNLEYNENEIIIKDYIGYIYITVDDVNLEYNVRKFININNTWNLMENQIYNISEKSTIKIINLSNDIKKIYIYTSN